MTGGEFAASVLPRNAIAAMVNVAARVIAPVHISLSLPRGAKDAQSHRVRYWEIIADNLSEAGWSWGCVSGVDSNGRTIFAVDAHRDGKHFIVRADES